MEVIHRYLREVADLNTGPGQAIKGLLDILLDGITAPRSVSVRLYHLFQTNRDSEIRRIWQQFGIQLMSGGLVEPRTKPLWALRPSSAHYWAARLAAANNAVLVSLNYDGLTKRSVDNILGDGNAHTGRIISSAQEITGFFTGEVDTTIPRPVPIIKFRGDVFHATCESGRCPDRGKQVPLFALWPKDSTQEADTEKVAETQLKCLSCGQLRTLSISFPGVHVKEEDIEGGLKAFQQVVGSTLGAVIFMGFSGKWDESLVDYLIRRAAVLQVPTLSISKLETPAIQRRAEELRVPYLYKPYTSRESQSPDEVDSELESILSTDNLLASMLKACERRPPALATVFPSSGFSSPAFGPEPGKKISISLSMPGSTIRQITVRADDSAHDSFTGVISRATLSLPELDKLQSCSQLGAKSAFLREGNWLKEHNRFNHSVSTTLLTMLWHEALLPSTAGSHQWAWTKEARLALAMAVLFHDARHLPFSHMMEEILDELNWGRPGIVAAPEVRQHTGLIRPNLGEGVPLGEKLRETLNQCGLALGPEELATGSESWWATRVEAIQDGRSGVPWMEAFLDSALDTDKIDYIFRDTVLTGQSVRLPDEQTWLGDFLSYQRYTRGTDSAGRTISVCCSYTLARKDVPLSTALPRSGTTGVGGPREVPGYHLAEVESSR